MKKEKFIKATLILFSYLFYTQIFSYFLNAFGVNDIVTVSFVADLIFLFGIVCLYRKNMKKGFFEFFDKKNVRKNVFKIFKYVLLMYCSLLALIIIGELLFPGVQYNGENTTALYDLLTLSAIYTIFKTMIFAVIAEELVFKKSIRNIINNKILFVLVSALIYAIMNVMYSSGSYITFYDFLTYFILASVTAYAYVKNNDNIFLVMVIKFIYNLIPLSIMLAGVL